MTFSNHPWTSQVHCKNCCREGADITIHECSGAQTRKRSSKKYYTRMISYGTTTVTLCECCKEYLFSTSTRPDPTKFWPAMIFTFLNETYTGSTLEVTFQDRWNLIPAQWKPWWINFFSHQIDDSHSLSLFRDVTRQREELNEAINDLNWLPLARCMDQHFAYPEIRCPFGCSEFLHAAKTVPLEDFLWAFSNYQMDTYCKAERKVWTDCISPSYPSSCLILERFECSPAVALTDDGMMILCCREHSKHCKDSYLYIPECPERTGTIYSPTGNAFAPVVIRPRTARHFKSNTHSDTFCTVKQMGGFSGVDSAYVTTSNKINKQDNMAMLRDALSIQGRPDIKAQIQNRATEDVSSPSFLPKRSVDSIVRYAEKEFPDPSTLPQWKTSTFIPCESAVSLQEKMYGESSLLLKVFADATTEEHSLERYCPPWPTHFVNIQTMDDYGRRIFPVRERDINMWLLLCMTGRVTELWEEMASSVADNRSWLGHWLRYATAVLGFKGISRSSKFFPTTTEESTSVDIIYDVFDPPLCDSLSNKTGLSRLFEHCSKVLVVENDLPTEEQLMDELANKQIIICLNPNATSCANYNGDLLELRCLLSLPESDRPVPSEMDGEDMAESENDMEVDDHDASESPEDESEMEEDIDDCGVPEKTMYTRHPGKKFWIQQGNGFTSKCAEDSPSTSAWCSAYIALFCRKQKSDSVDLQRRYMNVLGGQSSAFCSDHKCPLILNHRTKKSDLCHHKCVFPVLSETDSLLPPASEPHTTCQSYAEYVCPMYRNCGTAICKSHVDKCTQHCSECTHGTVMFLSPRRAEYTTFRVGDSGGLEGNVSNDAQNNVPPEALGPTAAYEIPQDFLDQDSQEASARAAEEEDAEADPFGILENGGQGGNIPESEMEGGSSFVDYELMEAVQHEAERLASTDGFAGDQNENENLLADQNEDIPGEADPFDATGLFPTRTGTQQVDIELEQRDGKGAIIPLVTFLNAQGHLLTRSSDKIRMCKAHAAVCQKIVATNSSRVIPLVYAEAQLFPEIFYQSLADGTIPGALPTALWTDSKNLRKLDIANMRKHAMSRITNPALLTSVHPAYHFMLMDLQVNIGLRGKDTRLILHRGFADIQGKDGVRFREKSDAAELYGEASENHANVHKLSALCQEKEPHFFFTQSCNQETCRGLRVMRDWITSNEAKTKIANKYGISDTQASKFLRESAASYILRSWNEVVDMWMRYIIHSSEVPLGKIEYAWYRKEFQGVLRGR